MHDRSRTRTQILLAMNVQRSNLILSQNFDSSRPLESNSYMASESSVKKDEQIMKL